MNAHFSTKTHLYVVVPPSVRFTSQLKSLTDYTHFSRRGHFTREKEMVASYVCNLFLATNKSPIFLALFILFLRLRFLMDDPFLTVVRCHPTHAAVNVIERQTGL